MKKQLTGLLALLAGLTCFAGCLDDKKGDSSSNQGSDSSVETPAYNLDAAKNAIYGKYPTKDEGRENYELPNSYEVDGVVYTLEWSTNATENVVLDRGADTTYVDVNTGLAADFEYNLIAKLSAPDGTSINVPFRRTLKAAPTAVLSPITAAPVADQAYKLYMYQSLKKNDLFFTGKMSGFYMATTNASNGETFEDGVDVYAVPVDGKEGVFNLQFTYEDKVQYVGLTNTYNNGSWHDNAILAESTVVAENANQTFEFTYNADYGTVVATLENVKSGKDANATEGTTETFFLGTSNTYYTFGAMNVDEINNANTYVGKLVMMLDKANIAAEDKVAHTKQEIGVDSIFAGDNVVRLMDQGDRYPEASITWAITTDSTNFVLNGAKLTTTAVETTQNATLTATITCGDVTDTVSFEIKLVKVLNSAAEIVDAAYALANGESLPIAYELTGKITTIKTPYDSGYKNVTVIIEVEGKEDKPITCFRLKGEGADLIKVGDTITVSGILKNYNDTIEFDAGCALLSYVVGEEGGNEGGEVTPPEGGDEGETPDLTTTEGILKALYALADGESLTGPFTITGKITALDSYSNPTIVVEGFETMPVYCYKLVVSNAVGDTITVTAGSMTNYKGKYEFMDCTLVSSEVGGGEEGGDEGGDEGDAEVVPGVVPEVGKAYIFGMTQKNIDNTVYYLAGGMSGFYMATTTDASAAIATYIEATDGGYYFYTYVDDVKTYINMVVSGTHVNGAYEATASTVYTIDEANHTLIATVNDVEYWFATRNDKSYDTMGPCAVSYEGFFGVFYETEVHEHSHEAVVTAPTCTEAGYTTYTCACGDSYTADEVAATGHSYVDGACSACGLAEVHEHNHEAVVTAPTCTEAGYTTYTCACGDTYTEEGEAATGHSHEAVVTAPTCGVAGFTTYTCACGDTYTADEVAATGEHSGYAEDYKCDACSMAIEPEADTTLTLAQAIKLADALGAGKYSTNSYYLTCEIVSIYNTQYGNANVTDADGTDYVLYGLYEGDTRYDSLEYKPVKGDTITVYGPVGSYNATSYQMKNAQIKNVVAHEHKYDSVVTEPTCTADGYTTHTCSICENTYTDSEVAALGHTTENGTCENCGKEISAENPGLTDKSYSHTFTSSSVFTSETTKELDGVNWTISGTKPAGDGYWGWDTNSSKGQQLGSSKKYYTELTVKSESFSNVSQIKINTCGASSTNAKCVVYVGETNVGEITLTSTATDYTFDVAGLSGEIRFEYTQTSKKAIYIKSIAVDYAE